MSAAKLKVEFWGGTDIGDAAKDMVRLAEQLQCDVTADFNGVTLLIKPGDTPQSLEAAYHDERAGRQRFAMGAPVR